MAARSQFIGIMDYQSMAYDGSVELFYEWQLWAMKQWNEVKHEEMVRNKLTASIVEQLRCEAYYVAVDLGYKVLQRRKR